MSDVNIETHCKHFVKRKKRYCKMTVKRGLEYCGEHIPNNGENNDRDSKLNTSLRIVCPLDKKHTCYAHKLAKHLKICNARPDNSLLYIHKDCNRGEISSDEYATFTNNRQLSIVATETIKDLVRRLNIIYDEEITGIIVENVRTNPVLEEEIRKPEFGDRTKKHLVQASSLLGHLEQNNLVMDETCYIEFGAGRGQLSFWISQVISKCETSSVLLVERASHRHKLDNKLDKSEGKVQRVKVDIADLILNKVESVEKCKRVIGLTKHLCGDATDLTLRCLENFERCGGVVSGVVMAFCCHHRCQWSDYTGKSFFMEKKLSRTDFDVMCGMVSWAVCGSGHSRNQNKSGPNMNDVNQRDKEIGLSREEKEEVGKRCKHILDYGRMSFLKNNGFSCTLNYYVNSSISPENVCMVATKT